jgi:hypothetical protein
MQVCGVHLLVDRIKERVGDNILKFSALKGWIRISFGKDKDTINAVDIHRKGLYVGKQ